MDTEIFSMFKHHYQCAADEYLDQQELGCQFKLSAKKQRILCTKLVSTAWIRTVQSVDFERAFKDIGYTWTDESPFSPRPLTGYVFDPTTVDDFKSDDSEDHEEIEKDVIVINTKARTTCNIIINNNNNDKMKQLSMDNFIKTIK